MKNLFPLVIMCVLMLIGVGFLVMGYDKQAEIAVLVSFGWLAYIVGKSVGRHRR